MKTLEHNGLAHSPVDLAPVPGLEDFDGPDGIIDRINKPVIPLPAPIRDIFNLKKGSSVIFKLTDKGVFFLPCKITERNAYTQEEWRKIERLVAERGKSYKTAKGARKHLKSL